MAYENMTGADKGKVYSNLENIINHAWAIENPEVLAKHYPRKLLDNTPPKVEEFLFSMASEVA